MPDQPAQSSSRHVLGWVAIILALSALVVFALFMHWAIVTGHAKRQREDAEYYALKDIRVIFHAQREYYANNQFLGFPCTLQVLGGMPKAGAPQTDPTPTAAQLLDDSLASGHADGYTFTLSQCTHLENVGFNGNTAYHLTATPDHPGWSSFCVDDDVERLVPGEYTQDNPDIRTDPSGGAHCTQPAPNP
jgi:hypothetical protein